MENVVRTLGLYAPVYQKGDVHYVLAYTQSPITILAPYPDSLPSIDRINLNIIDNGQQIVLNNIYKYPINEIVSTPYGKLKFISNNYYTKLPITGKKKQLFFSLSTPKKVAPSFLNGLKAEAASKLSSIVDLSYRDTDPLRA